jgi:hypothetical protein
MTIRVLLLVLFCSCACAQEIPSISLKIKEDTLTCTKPCNIATASLVFTNESDNDILVYGLKPAGPIPAFNGLPTLCDARGTGIEFAMYRPDGTQQLALFEIVDHDIRKGKERATKKHLDSLFRLMNTQFLKSGMTLKKHEEITIVTEVPLEQFPLQKGLRYLQFVYYCGNKTAERLDSNGVKRSAPLFQGCATSAKIPFVSNYERKAKSYLDKE